jgi:hypothetical protein
MDIVHSFTNGMTLYPLRDRRQFSHHGLIYPCQFNNPTERRASRRWNVLKDITLTDVTSTLDFTTPIYVGTMPLTIALPIEADPPEDVKHPLSESHGYKELQFSGIVTRGEFISAIMEHMWEPLRNADGSLAIAQQVGELFRKVNEDKGDVDDRWDDRIQSWQKFGRELKPPFYRFEIFGEDLDLWYGAVINGFLEVLDRSNTFCPIMESDI